MSNTQHPRTGRPWPHGLLPQQRGLLYVVHTLLVVLPAYLLFTYSSYSEDRIFVMMITLVVGILGFFIVSFFFLVRAIESEEIRLPFFILISIMAMLIFSYADLYRYFGLTDGKRAITRAVDFLYFSIITWTTVGYGDIVPQPETRLIAASESLVGYIAMALIIAVVFFKLSKTR